ncbi:hypothetical protein ACHAWF_008259 [Thalassiosira exigua]
MKASTVVACAGALAASHAAEAAFVPQRSPSTSSRTALRFFGGGSGAKDLDEEVRARNLSPCAPTTDGRMPKAGGWRTRRDRCTGSAERPVPAGVGPMEQRKGRVVLFRSKRILTVTKLLLLFPNAVGAAAGIAEAATGFAGGAGVVLQIGGRPSDQGH